MKATSEKDSTGRLETKSTQPICNAKNCVMSYETNFLQKMYVLTFRSGKNGEKTIIKKKNIT